MAEAMEDVAVLTAALEGLATQREKVDRQIQAVKAELVKLGTPKALAAVDRERVLKPEARRRISTAQKKRWAEYRRRKARGAGRD